MLRQAIDENALVAVIVLEPPPVPNEWTIYVDAVRALNRRGSTAGRDVRPVVLQIMKGGLELPTAVERRAIAELRSEIRPNAINCVATDSVPFRMMGTAIDWIRKPHFASSWQSDVRSAIAFIEGELGRPCPELPRLLRSLERS